MKLAGLLAASIAALIILSSASVFAAEDVMVADFLFIRVRCPAAGYSAAERAAEVQQRVNNLLVLGGIDTNTIRARQVGGDWGVYAADKLVVTVDWCNARANNTTPERLARLWAARLKEIYPKVVPKAPQESGCTSEGCPI